MSESVIDTVKLGIEYIMLAIFLIFVSQVVQIRNSYAARINDREAQESAINETLEYSMYDTDEPISGDEVVSCIRNYSDGETAIFIDRKGFSASDAKARTDYSLDPNDTVSLADMFQADKGLSTGGFIFNTDKATNVATKKAFTRKWLSDHLKLSGSYTPYLIYDGADITDKTKYNKKGEAVTGIAFIYKS